MDTFLITGLPRSRTAWLSVFMTDREAFCFHEAMNGCYSWDDYAKKLDSIVGFSSVGNSDSSLAATEGLQELANAVPTVIIERDYKEVLRSLVSIFGYSDEIYALVKDMKANLDSIEGALRIPYEEIGDRLEEIWSWCVDSPFDAERAELLKAMNIQTTKIWGDPKTVEFLRGEI